MNSLSKFKPSKKSYIFLALVTGFVISTTYDLPDHIGVYTFAKKWSLVEDLHIVMALRIFGYTLQYILIYTISGVILFRHFQQYFLGNKSRSALLLRALFVYFVIWNIAYLILLILTNMVADPLRNPSPEVFPAMITNLLSLKNLLAVIIQCVLHVMVMIWLLQRQSDWKKPKSVSDIFD